MSNVSIFQSNEERLFLPIMSTLYNQFAQPYGWLIFRIIFGGMLVIEGWPKILDPFAQVGFVEHLGFYPGWLWSPLLAVMQFFGGMFIVAGLLTRPVAIANAVMLAITLWFHFAHPFGHAFLTPAGIEALQAGSDFFTPEGISRLSDGGVKFLHLVQLKAYLASLFWTVGTLLIAAFGGGYFSIDRLMKKQF
ncbi:DoxX family protein [Marinomonas posidonica]|uniref:DoxX family protein n=1 Tax=Marinomonas posidonica (strain CECT 7376 / NCIMB 14433 / IVIA-Po-181) TaxID=491952 RepID=F6CUZ0_MARPP|nr:DoxX family protein [Marinomonas posidonica]AEF55316.1 DoxX family protein [Marinomonas posidonica IVIA-Po-181]